MKKTKKKRGEKEKTCDYNTKGGGCTYTLAFIGAAIYYIQTATSFWGGVLGILKAAVWPAFLIYELLKFLAA